MSQFREASRGRGPAADDKRRGFLQLEAMRNGIANTFGRGDRRFFARFKYVFHLSVLRLPAPTVTIEQQ